MTTMWEWLNVLASAGTVIVPAMAARAAVSAHTGEVIFSVPEVPIGLNKLLRMHWAARRKYQQRWNVLLWAERSKAWWGYRPPPLRARVEIERRSSRVLDEDNLYGACKVVVDALKINELVVDDSPTHMELRCTQTKGAPLSRIRISPL